MTKTYEAKIWYSNNNTPLLKFPKDLLKDGLPIKLERTLLIVKKEHSIEIFNAEIPREILENLEQ